MQTGIFCPKISSITQYSELEQFRNQQGFKHVQILHPCAEGYSNGHADKSHRSDVGEQASTEKK